MVSKRDLMARIEKLEERNKDLAKTYEIVLKSCISLNKKVLKLMEKENKVSDEATKIKEWLSDDRVLDLVQHLNEAKK